jgi:hypothetical protein
MDDDDIPEDDQDIMEDEDLLLDEEFPPEAFPVPQEDFTNEDSISQSPAKSKASILSQLNKRSLPSRGQVESRGSNETMDLKGMATALTQSQELLMEEVIKLHRNHIRECAETGKLESKLLVNLTMKMGKNTSDPAAMTMSFDSYCRELDESLREKMNSIMELRAKIRDHLQI